MTKLLYLSGQIGLMIQLRFFFQWILSFYAGSDNEKGIISASCVGIVLLLFRLIDAILDPLIGQLSDRFLIKGYERSIFMKIAAPFMGIGLILSFNASVNFGLQANWIFLLTGFFLFFFGYTFYCVPYWALIDDISDDNEVRTQYSSLLGLGIFISTAIGFVFTPFLIKYLDYSKSALVVAIISSPLLYLPCLINVKSKLGATVVEKINYKTLIKPLFNKDFIKVVILLASVQVSFTALTSLSPIFVEVVLRQDKEYIAYVMGPVILVAIITFLFINMLLDNFGWSRVLEFSSIMLGILFILCIPVYFIFNNQKINFIFLFAFFGLPIACVLALEALAVLKVMKNQNEAGLYFGVFNFLIKAFNGFAIMVTSLVIDYAKSFNSIYSANFIVIYLGLLGLLILCAVYAYRSLNFSFIKVQ